MNRSNKVTLGIVGVIILSLLGGFLGAKLSGGNTPSAAAQTGSFIDDIKERGVLRVGIAEAAPLTTMEPDAEGNVGGPFVLPLRNLAEQLDVEFEAVPTTWANIVAGLQAGRYDFAAYLDNTLERATTIQFSNPVLTYPAVLVVDADSPFTSAQEVFDSGELVASPQGDAANHALEEHGAKLFEVDTFSNGTAALKAGRVAALSADLGTAGGIVGNDETLKIIVPDPVYYQSGSGFGLPEDVDPRSLNLVNIAILDAQDYGELSTAFDAVGYREIENLGDWAKN